VIKYYVEFGFETEYLMHEYGGMTAHILNMCCLVATAFVRNILFILNLYLDLKNGGCSCLVWIRLRLAS
jgi:hypothetical protein